MILSKAFERYGNIAIGLYSEEVFGIGTILATFQFVGKIPQVIILLKIKVIKGSSEGKKNLEKLWINTVRADGIRPN